MLNSFYLLLLFTVCASGLDKKPNFVMFLTDDQDVVLGGMDPMRNVHHHIGDNGLTFTNSFTTSPICCPSRASLLSGQYPHNHYTQNNSVAGGCYGTHWKKHERNTFPAILNKAGYKTFYAGKYLNQYGEAHAGGPQLVPPGWTEWRGLVGNSVYYNYTLSNNGVPTFSSELYLTDVLRDLAVNFVEAQSDSQPFLAVIAPPAPHQPFTPAPRHAGKFCNVTAVRHPNFNIAVDDKHWLLRMPPSPLPATALPELDRVYRSRWESLLAVDEMVQSVVEALENSGLIDDTYLIFTSDNGYHIGQFSQVYDKRQPYETDIRVPLLISGPGITKNSQSKEPVLNIDLAPTILSLAGIEPPKTMDGHAIDVFSTSEGVKERNMLIEYYGEGGKTVADSCPWKYDDINLSECYPQYECKCQDARNNTFACVRHLAATIDYKYCLFHDQENFMEIYDLRRDPFELRNIVDEVFPAVKTWYRLELVSLLECAGAASCDHPMDHFYDAVKVVSV